MSIKFIISILQKVHYSQHYSPESWSMSFTYLKTVFQMNRVKHRKSKSLGLSFRTFLDVTNVPLMSNDVPLSYEEFL